jgi:hypothetical protein
MRAESILGGVVRGAPRSTLLETAVLVTVTLTIVAFVCGSSSIASLDRAGKGARWVLLFVLLAETGVLAWRERSWRRVGVPGLAAWLLALTFLSTTWSVDPRQSFEHAASLAVLFAVAFLLATTVDGARVLVAVLTGAVVVALAGLAMLALDHSAAVQTGTIGVQSRFRGLGENANTAALLFGVVLPIAAWAILRARTPQARVLAVAAFLLLDGSIAGSGSRGALASGFIGTLVVALAATRATRERGLATAAACVMVAASFWASTIPKPLSHNPPAPAAATGHAKPGYADANIVFPLTDDVGRALPHEGETQLPRQVLGSSGRTAAWRGAVHLTVRRPVAGYGFGTEESVFVDRYAQFAGGLPENSYLDVLLQIGIVGLVSFLALVGWWLVRAARAFGRAPAAVRATVLVPCAAMVAAGLVAGAVQSYVLSVGNVATASLWIALFLLSTVPGSIQACSTANASQ